MKAEKVVAMTKELLKLLGIEEERLRLEWISASEGAKFAETITSFTAQIEGIGKSPVGAYGA